MNEKYIEWLEKMIDNCLKDKTLQKEHWAFCLSLKKYRELTNNQSNEQEDKLNWDD